MEDKFLKNIREEFNKIEPSQEFKNRSSRLIFSSYQNRPINFNFFNPSFVIGLVGVLTIFAVGGLIFNNLSLSEHSNFNGAELLSEAENLNFQIHLEEAEYFDDSAKEIAAILKEIEQSN